MKITKKQLKQIIKEELLKVLNEGSKWQKKADAFTRAKAALGKEAVDEIYQEVIASIPDGEGHEWIQETWANRVIEKAKKAQALMGKQ